MTTVDWEVVRSADGERHVMPRHDLRPHDTDRNCWCRPFEDFKDGEVVIHNSMDRREFVERGETRRN